MKTKKSISFILFALAAVVVLALSCFFITACDDDEKLKKYRIEWKVDDKASVKIAGGETLPSEWVKDTELAFTVSAPDGYNISVKAYSLLSAKDGANLFAHLGMKNGDYYPNVGLTPSDANQSITCNGLTFSFTDADKIELTQDWQKGLLYINVAAATGAEQE